MWCTVHLMIEDTLPGTGIAFLITAPKQVEIHLPDATLTSVFYFSLNSDAHPKTYTQ